MRIAPRFGKGQHFHQYFARFGFGHRRRCANVMPRSSPVPISRATKCAVQLLRQNESPFLALGAGRSKALRVESYNCLGGPALVYNGTHTRPNSISDAMTVSD